MPEERESERVQEELRNGQNQMQSNPADDRRGNQSRFGENRVFQQGETPGDFKLENKFREHFEREQVTGAERARSKVKKHVRVKGIKHGFRSRGTTQVRVPTFHKDVPEKPEKKFNKTSAVPFAVADSGVRAFESRFSPSRFNKSIADFQEALHPGNVDDIFVQSKFSLLFRRRCGFPAYSPHAKIFENGGRFRNSAATSKDLRR